MARNVRISKQTPLVDGDKFDITGCLGYSITNVGQSDASYGYEGNSETFDVAQGDTKVYGFLPDGLQFFGQMEVKFKEGKGKLDIILFKAQTEEN